MTWALDQGARYLGAGRCRFRVWAPAVKQVEVALAAPREEYVLMEPQEDGYHQATLEGVEPGRLYFYRLDGARLRPDPASRFQPQGVHGSSQIVDPRFAWEDDDWHGLPLEEHVFYELHVGTFTPEGTFMAVIPLLDGLKELGITALELMPVAQFPGRRNWGYDGVYPFAVQDSYGGPDGLKHLVNACHRRGLAVVLDVVYNHLGPEGNYLWDFGPYFAQTYRTPWGAAINFDGPGSDGVRRFLIDNALYWITEFHMDALRLDAVHAIFDTSACSLLQELAEEVHAQAGRLNRRVYAIAETSLNNPLLLRCPERGGYGLDAQWNDDFQRALHALLTGERGGYYADFGRLADLEKAFTEGYVLTGQYSHYRQRRHGRSSRELAARQLVVFGQNHDQVGNRLKGERTSRLLSWEECKLVAGAVILSPYLPLLFMGEEYGEVAPFHYFISHSDPDVVESVRRGRQALFAAFGWRGDAADPQDETTFFLSRLDHGLRQSGRHRVLYEWHRELLRLRKAVPALAELSRERMEVVAAERQKTLLVRRWSCNDEACLFMNFSDTRAAPVLPWAGRWHKELDSADSRWLGDGQTLPDEIWAHEESPLPVPPRTFALFRRIHDP
jgi:maltooligosyltrehalose trehalohydrolase